MQLVLVREFESHRREILNLFAKIKNKDQLLRAPNAGKHNSTRVAKQKASGTDERCISQSDCALNVASNVASVKKHIIFWGRFRRFFGGRFRRIQNHSTTHRAQHTQQHTAHTRAKPTNLSPAGRLGGTPTAHKRETCHRHSRGRLVDPRTQLHRTRPQGQKLGPKDRISCGPANLATSSNPRRQVGSSRGFGGIPLHQMSSLKVGVRSLERVWWMLQSWRQRQQQ